MTCVRRRGCLGLSLILSLGLAMGCDDGGNSEVAPPPPVVAEGPEADYARYCALCHGAVGQGYTADNANMLANQDWLAAASDTFILSAIVNGRPGTPMSAWGDVWGGPLSPERAQDLVALIRQWQLPTTSETTLPDVLLDGASMDRGRAVYDARCASCHGALGDGVSAVSLNNPQFLNDVSDGYLADAILRGRGGTPMRGYAEDLTEQSVADLIVLIRSWQEDVGAPVSAPLEHDFANAALNPGGGEPQWTVRDDRFVAVAEVARALEEGAQMVFVDARAPGDYIADHISGAVSVPFYDAQRAVDKLPSDVWIVAYCGCPHAASSELADALIDGGYDKVVVLDEGFFHWRDEGHPTTSGPDP